MKDYFTVQTDYGHIVWNLNDKLRKILRPIAAEFDLTVKGFLTQYSRSSLPGQLLRPEEPPMMQGFKAESLCFDKETWARLERAAILGEKDINKFVWGAIASFITCYEEDMILSPRTGRPIGDEAELEEFQIERVRRATDSHQVRTCAAPCE